MNRSLFVAGAVCLALGAAGMEAQTARVIPRPPAQAPGPPNPADGSAAPDGYAPIPEQSTLALIAHHPQAIYFGTRQGRLLPDGSPDDVIKGSPRDPSLFGELDDEDPPEGAVEAEDEPALAS